MALYAGYGDSMVLHKADALVVHHSQNPRVLILEYEVQGKAVRTGNPYHNRFVSIITIEGRKTDLINRGGNKVFPDQVEEVLLLASGVREAAVVGIPDDRLGEVPVAFVVGEVDEEELTSLCREPLVPYKIPVMFRRVDSLPRSEVGKVLRQRLAEMADQG